MFPAKVIEKIKTHILRSIISFFENPSFYEITWKNIIEPAQATDDNIIRHMRIACWIPKATNTHSEYVILTAFPLQQWLHESFYVIRTLLVLLPSADNNTNNAVIRTRVVVYLARGGSFYLIEPRHSSTWDCTCPHLG